MDLLVLHNSEDSYINLSNSLSFLQNFGRIKIVKIGIFDPYLDDLGGGEKYMMTIAQCLSKKHEVSVFWDRKEDLKHLLLRFSIDLSAVKIENNIFDRKISLLERLRESRKFDYIIVLSDGSIPLVSSKLLIHIQQPLQRMQTGSLLDKLKLSRVKYFFCNSEYTKKFIEKKFSVRVNVIYPPIKLKPKSLRKENIILTVGRFRVKNVKSEDYKKQSVMIDEFKQLVDEGLKDWKFVLAVSVWDKEKKDFEQMRKNAEGYPIDFLINKSNDELWIIYSRAKIYWHATGYGEDLEKNPEYAEHFGISTVEAMGGGTVPVVIGTGGQIELVSDGENGFLWDNTTELRQKTSELIKNPQLLQRMSLSAKKRAKYFADQNFCEKIEELIEK